MTRISLVILATVVPLCSSSYLLHNGDFSSASVAEVIRTLDTDHSGVVEEAEIEAYAEAKGLNSAEAHKEFQEIDKNSDGILEANELSSSLGAAEDSPAPTATVTEIGPVTLMNTEIPIPPVQKTAAAQQSIPPEALVVPDVALAAAAAGDASALMDESSLLLEVRQQANRAVAEAFAKRAEEILASRTQHEADAAQLEEHARALRQNASAIVSSAPQLVANAAEHVVKAHADQKFADARALQTQAEEVYRQASAARSEAQQAGEQARSAQGAIMSVVQQLRARGA